MKYLIAILFAVAALAPVEAEAFRIFRRNNNCNNNGRIVNVQARGANVQVNRNNNNNNQNRNNNNQNNNQSAADDRDGEVVDRLNELALLQPFINPVAAPVTPVPPLPETPILTPSVDNSQVDELKKQIEELKKTIDDLKNKPAPIPAPETPPQTPKTDAPAAPSSKDIFYDIERRK